MESKQLSWLVKGYKNAVGDFDVKTLLYLLAVFLVTAVLPFTRPDFNAGDITIMFVIITMVKMAINLQTKKMMAQHTTDKGLTTNEEIVEKHSGIKETRLSIEQQKYNRFLPKAVREENLKVDLNTLYTNINNIMIKSKEDEEVLDYTTTLEKIEELLDLIENGKDYTEEKKALTLELSKIKRSSLTVASLYSKNDSIDRVKKYDLDIDKAITKMTQRSAAISIGMVAIINFMTFIYLGATKDTVVQSLMNTAMLVFSGVMGVDAGRKIVLQYVNIAGEKLEFLKSFLIRAEHYAKPTDDDLEQKRIREDKEEEIRFNKEQEKEQREYTREIEREQRKLTHEAKMAEIKTQGEVARAKILEANKPQEQQTIKLEVVNKEAK
jgi:hypothetical protein